MKIPFGPYEPDRSPFAAGSVQYALNCLPRKDGWGPMAMFSEVSEALADEPRGLLFCRDSAGGLHTFAGTVDNLYKLDTSSFPYTWDEVSKTTDAYALPAGHRWGAAQWGDYAVFSHTGDVIQKFDLTSDTAFSDLAGSPQARFIFPAGDFLMTAYLSGAKTGCSGLV